MLENIIVHYILLMMFDFYFIFYCIIITDVIVILRCYIGSLMEMNQNLLLYILFLLVLYLINDYMRDVVSPGLMLLAIYIHLLA